MVSGVVEEPSSAAHLDQVITKYRQRNVQSAKAHADAVQHLPGGNTRTTLHVAPFPLTFVKGEGAVLYSADGDRYLDFLSEYTAALFGHNHPAILTAIKDGLDQGYNLGASNLAERDFARAVCARFAPAMDLVRFTNSGTEANMCAIATALAWTSRKKILVFEGGYHGSTIGFPAGAPHHAMLLPHDFVVAPTYNDIPGTYALAASLPKESLAAILVEPMQGSGGAIPASTEFLRSLRTLADAHGALLICDEVMTSRLAPHGLAQSLGVRPDLMTLGKWLSGGMSFGAFGGRRDIMNLFDPERRDGRGLIHAGTFNNNTVSMAGGVAAIKTFDEEAVHALNEVAGALQTNLEALLTAYGFQNPPDASSDGQSRMWLSGRGSILAMRFAGAGEADRRALFWHHLLDQGIYVAPRGFISLSVMTTEEDCEVFVGAVRGFLERYEDGRRVGNGVNGNGHANGNGHV